MATFEVTDRGTKEYTLPDAAPDPCAGQHPEYCRSTRSEAVNNKGDTVVHLPLHRKRQTNATLVHGKSAAVIYRLVRVDSVRNSGGSERS